MLIRTRLLLLGLTTLALPWAGCQYAREMEGALRDAEKMSLQAVASTIAVSLQGRRDLLTRDAGGPGSAAPPGPLDLEAMALRAAPVLDGRASEWPGQTPLLRRYTAQGGGRLEVRAGTHERYLYLSLRSDDDTLVFDRSDALPLDAPRIGDRVWLGFTDRGGTLQQVFVGAAGPGPVRGRRIVVRELGRREAIDEPRIEGYWLRLTDGWRLELRLPLSMIGERLGVLHDDRDRRGADAVSIGNLYTNTLAPRGRLLAAAPELRDELARFRQSGVRLQAASASGTVVAEVNALPAGPGTLSAGNALLSQLYRGFMQRSALAERVTDTQPGRVDSLQARAAAAGQTASALLASREADRLIVTAIAPVFDTDQRILGMVQVAQTADRWLVLRDRALTRLVNLTLMVSALAIAAMLLFSLWLAARLRRLRRASEQALDAGTAAHRSASLRRLATDFPDTTALDELGDVSRSFARLLGRLDEYTSYLRTLAGKLAHELRTPLTIVRSSLDNLDAEVATPAARDYLARAREGSERLAAILNAMGAASRVEDAIETADSQHFELGPLLQGAVEAYGTAFPARQFRCELQGDPLSLDGSPDLIMQMLDKLVDNAVDFSPPGSTIVLRPRATRRGCASRWTTKARDCPTTAATGCSNHCGSRVAAKAERPTSDSGCTSSG
ncbi:MAG: histidine kinase dimerization/phospho-acceptor domain-containing protein [Steroidobacteraceae bacterium]